MVSSSDTSTPGEPVKTFSDVERLRQEALDLTRAGHGEFVFFRQFVHAQNGDDVLQVLVALQGLLHRVATW